MIRTGTGIQPTPVTRHRDTQPNKKADGNLGAINGRATVRDGTRTVGGQSALNPNGTTHLAAINGRAALSKVSDKSAAINTSLNPSLAARLDQRLASASKAERKEIEAVLHFSHSQTGGTSKSDRAEIRTAVAAYLAHGGGIEGAKLIREAASEMPAKHRKDLISEFVQNPDRHGSAIVAEKVLLQRDTTGAKAKLGTQETPAERFEHFKLALTDFPPAPEKAGELLFVNPTSVGVGYNAAGRLEIRSATTAMVGETVPDSNKDLPQTKLADIRDAFDTVAQGNYSTMGLPLDFMHFFGKENERRADLELPPLSMKEAFKQYQPNGADITDGYNGTGNCMNHAERIVAELASRGIEARIVGHFSDNLIKMTDPAKQSPNDLVFIPGLEDATEKVTHLDVIVPYTNQQGEERVILISPGIGTNDPNAYRDFPMSDLSSDPDLCYKRVDPRTGSYDATKAQKASFPGRHNVQLVTTPIDGDPTKKKLVGIDLLAGKLYLNRAASDQYRGAHGQIQQGQDQGAVSIDFKAAMADPGGATTIKTWDPVSGAYQAVPTTKLAAFLAMATAIKDEFGQPDRFVEDLLVLAANHDAYRGEMIAPPLTAMHDVTRERNAAIQSKPANDSPNLATWQMHFDGAAECIANGDAETARKHYQVAARLGG